MDLILDFTHTYSEKWIKMHSEMIYINCADLGGTDMYCSPESVLELEKRIGRYPLKGIHFMDSGNYHYMTKLFTGRIQKPYVLVYFDNHTDCQPTMIPELLSCGAWAKQVIEEDACLKKMILIGPKQEAIDEIAVKNNDKLVTISREEFTACVNSGSENKSGEETNFVEICRLLQEKLNDKDYDMPLYISIDKDVLDRKSSMTNWDQGVMTPEELKSMLRFFFMEWEKRGSEILGVDICGELPEKEASYGEAAKALEINQRINEELVNFCRGCSRILLHAVLQW